MKCEPGPRGTTLRDFCATSMGAPEGRAKKVTATQSRARQSKAQQCNAKQRKRKAKQCKGNAKQSKAKQNKAVGKEKSQEASPHVRRVAPGFDAQSGIQSLLAIPVPPVLGDYPASSLHEPVATQGLIHQKCFPAEQTKGALQNLL